MTSKSTNHQVNGKQYRVWSDYIKRATYAEDENGEIKMIRGNGYLSNELSIRKAIANAYHLPTFRK